MHMRRIIPIFSFCAIIFGSIFIALGTATRLVVVAPNVLPDIAILSGLSLKGQL